MALVTAGSLSGCLGRPGPLTETPTPTSTWEDDVEFGEEVDEAVFVEASSYEFTPGSDDPIEVSHGATVGIAMLSTDNGYHAGHGLAIDHYQVNLSALVDQVDTVVFDADTAGEFHVWCSVPCSDGHHGMTGTFIVR